MRKITIVFCVTALVISVAYAQSNRVTVSEDSAYRYITSNGIPEHRTGQFPNRGNPNAITEQQYQFRVPLHPKVASHPIPLDMAAFGVARNGIPLDPGAAEFWKNDWNSGWQYEAMSGRIPLGIDQNNAHVQPNGAYHYHAMPSFAEPSPPAGQRVKQMYLFGYAADGFPIYALYAYSDPKDMRSALKPMRSSYQLKEGLRPSGPGGYYDGTFVADYEYVKDSGDLDECNGRFGVTPDYPQGIYHYVLTKGFPFIPRYFRGTPDASFRKRGPGPGDHGGQGGPHSIPRNRPEDRLPPPPPRR